MRRILLACAVVLVAIPAAGQDQGIWASGTNCGDWAQQRVAGATYVEWYLVGLIDGLALGTHTEIWRAGGIKITGEQVFLWMDKLARFGFTRNRFGKTDLLIGRPEARLRSECS